ncbi:MAG: hypothetical protein AAF799_10050 [Myxococcota bacterium]
MLALLEPWSAAGKLFEVSTLEVGPARNLMVTIRVRNENGQSFAVVARYQLSYDVCPWS